MSFGKSIAIEVPSEVISNLLKTLFGESEKQHHAGEFSHPALVSVKSGDGIGFDAGEVVMVSNAKNNVNMLFKANYDEPSQYTRSCASARIRFCLRTIWFLVAHIL